MNVGSLFTGIRGLDLGLEAAGCRTAWTCESDPACQRVIERTLPGVPVIGDIRDVDDTAPPVDVLAGGFPCPDFSVAGKRLMFKGERAQLWFEFARCVRLLRPRHVIVENVPGLLAALGVVLADLAEAGYVGRWFCLRAADIGAPHRRERVFIVATDTEHAFADAVRGGVDADPGVRRGDTGGRDQPGRAALSRGPEVALAADVVADRAGAAADTDGVGRETRPGLRSGDERGSGRRLPDDDRRETPSDAAGDTRRQLDRNPEAAADRHSEGRGRVAGASPGRDEVQPDKRSDADRRGRVAWGAYEPAIRRWEQILGRPAPRPTDDRGRLDPRFVEWMLGFDDDWTAGEKRTARLRMLGNAVQVQVAEQVGRILLEEAA